MTKLKLKSIINGMITEGKSELNEVKTIQFNSKEKRVLDVCGCDKVDNRWTYDTLWLTKNSANLFTGIDASFEMPKSKKFTSFGEMLDQYKLFG